MPPSPESRLERLRDAFRASRGDAASGLAGSFDHLVRRCAELLHGEELTGRSVLEVGAGGGFLSHYLVEAAGASHVTALDEYEGHGSPESSEEALRALREALGAESRVEVVKCDFLDFQPARSFDCVLMVNALHHIVETPQRLSRDAEHWKRALAAFERVGSCLAPGGVLLVQELSCYNYCFLPAYRRRMAGVRWRNKQPPGEWCAALRGAGFAEVSVRYRYPLNLPELPALRPLLANRLASLLTDSSYVIRARAA